jgi:hypothetical protein
MFPRGALAALAMCGVLFPGLAAGLHVHHDHMGGDCDLCFHLSHLVFALADIGPATDRTTVADLAPVPDGAPIVAASPSGDPARAPPALS